MLYALIGSNIACVLLIALRFSSLPPQIPLWYSLPVGDEQIADLWLIATLPLCMNLFVALNVFLKRKFFTDNRLMQTCFTFANYFIIISFTLLFFKIVLMVS